jgi:hypothetical protein
VFSASVQVEEKEEIMKRNQIIALLLMSSMLSLMPACNGESERNEPVATTSDAGSSTAAPAKEAEKRENALVRVVNAFPGDQTMDVYIGGTKMFRSVGYKKVTSYTETSEVNSHFTIKPMGHDNEPPIAESSERMSSGEHYTAVAIPAADGSLTLHVMADSLTPTSLGKANVRIINAAADAGKIDAMAKGTRMFNDIDFQRSSLYREFDPLNEPLEIRSGDKNDLLLTIPDTNFQAGHRYTIIVMGKVKGSPKLEAVKIDDLLIGATPYPTAAPGGPMSK